MNFNLIHYHRPAVHLRWPWDVSGVEKPALYPDDLVGMNTIAHLWLWRWLPLQGLAGPWTMES